MKRLFSLILSAALVLSTSVIAFAEEGSIPTGTSVATIEKILKGADKTASDAVFIEYLDTYIDKDVLPGAVQMFKITANSEVIKSAELTPEGSSAIPYTIDMPASEFTNSFVLVSGIKDYTLKFVAGTAGDDTTDTNYTVTFKYLSVNDDSGTPPDPGEGETPDPDPGEDEDPPANVTVNVVADVTAPTSKQVTLTCSISGEISNLIIKDPSGGKSTQGTASRTWTTTENGSYTFSIIDDVGAEVGSKSFTISNIDKRVPSIKGITYSNVTANTMTTTVDLGEFDANLYRIDTSSLPSGYTGNLSGSSLVIAGANSTASLKVQIINQETSAKTQLAIEVVHQSFASGTLKFVDYNVTDWDEDDIDLRLNFSGMEGYTFDTKSLSSKYKAKVSGSNSIDISADNKSQTIKLEFKDSEGKTHRESVKIYKAPVVSKVEATDLTASKTTFKFFFEGLSGSFYDLDDDQFDSDYRAKWSNGVLSLRLETEDDTIDIEFTDDYNNSYDLSYDLDLDELKSAREISINTVSVISKDDTAKKAVVEINFNGVRDLVLDDSNVWDYQPKKMDSTTYQMTVPYGKKTISFEFEDEDWDKVYTVKYEFRIDESTPIGTTGYDKDGNTTGTSSGTGTNTGTKPNGNVPQTGGLKSSLDILIGSIAV